MRPEQLLQDQPAQTQARRGDIRLAQAVRRAEAGAAGRPLEAPAARRHRPLDTQPSPTQQTPDGMRRGGRARRAPGKADRPNPTTAHIDRPPVDQSLTTGYFNALLVPSWQSRA